MRHLAMMVLPALLIASSLCSLCSGQSMGKMLAIGNRQLGPCMAAVCNGNTLYVIGSQTLYCLDVSKPASPQLLGQCDGLGDVRQLVVQNNIAYVASREDGLFLVDVSDPRSPSLLSHYDTLEKATGLAVQDQLAFIANRSYGVECVDITNPRKPRFISSVQTGEAQSVAVQGSYLYAGIWLAGMVSVVDIHNPSQMTVVDKVQLQGFGDGLCVRDGYLYAATGHHARIRGGKLVHHLAPDQPGYGAGHGMEIFDLADPAHPKFVSRVDLPKYFGGYMDLWSVQVHHQRAYVADTYNGMFVIDVQDVRKPHVIASCQLPMITREKVHDPATGLAVGDGVIYVAGGFGDLYTVMADELTRQQAIEPVTCKAPANHTHANRLGNVDGWQTFMPEDAMVRDVAAVDPQHVIVAAGRDGLYLLKQGNPLLVIAHQPTSREARGVSVLGNRLAVAQGDGVTLWQITPTAAKLLEKIGEYRNAKGVAMQAQLACEGRLILTTDGDRQFQILDALEPTRIKPVLGPMSFGLFYRPPVTYDGKRYAAITWNVAGPQWFDLANPSAPNMLPVKRRDAANSAALVDGQTWLLQRNGYRVMPIGYDGDTNTLPLMKIDNQPLNGSLMVTDDWLFATSRAWGVMRVVDVHQPDKPRLLKQYDLKPGQPSQPLIHGGMLWVPNGHAGLWYRPVRDLERGK